MPVFSVSLPNSPAVSKKASTYTQHYRTVPCPIHRSLSHSVLSSPVAERSIPPQGSATHLSTLPAQREGLQRNRGDLQNLYSNLPSVQTKQVNHQRRVLSKQHSIDELRSMVHTVADTFSHANVHCLESKMVAATELMTDNVEENVQALNLLVEVVEKLQGLIVSSKSHTASPTNCPKQRTSPQRMPPQPPRRVSSLSPKVVRKVQTLYTRRMSTSSSSACSSSSNSLNFYPDAYKPSRRDAPNKSVTFRRGNSNGQVRLNNGTVSRAPSSDQYN